jgi:hypothetical protein
MEIAMSQTTPTSAADDHAPAPDWENLFPADPDLMASAEGDSKGLAELKRKARERIARQSAR